MANSLTTNPIYIDSTTEATITNPVRIYTVIWTGVTTADHVCSVVDPKTGTVLIYLKSTGTKTNVSGVIPINYQEGLSCPNGIKVLTLDSGVLQLVSK